MLYLHSLLYGPGKGMSAEPRIFLGIKDSACTQLSQLFMHENSPGPQQHYC